MLERAFGQNWKSIAIGIEKKRVELQAEIECLATMHEENLSELQNARQQADKLAEGLENRDEVSDEYLDNLVKEYRGDL